MTLHMWRMNDGMIFFTAEKKMTPFFEGAKYLGHTTVTMYDNDGNEIRPVL